MSLRGSNWLIVLASCLLSAQSGNMLRDYYLRMIAPAGPVPEFEDVLSVMDRINTEPKAKIRDALPVVTQTLRNGNQQIVIWGTYAVGVIAMRTDGEELLTPYIDGLGQVLTGSPDARVQNTLLATFARFSPGAVAKIRPQLFNLLQAGSSPQVKAGVAGLLLKSGANSAEVLVAVAAYAKAPMDVQSRAQLITQLGVPGLSYPPLVKVCQDGLSDPDPNVKIASIHAIRRIGEGAIAPARQKLSQLSLDTKEDALVRQRAEELLRNEPEGPYRLGPLVPPGFPPSSVRVEQK